MAKCISFFVIMILTGPKIHAKEFESAIYTQYVGEVTSAFLKEMYKEYGFECGASGGMMPFDVEEISVSLVAYQSATVEQARELEIKTTERFAQIINAHEKIRPFLREYPFPSSQVDVSIAFEKPKKNKTSLGNDVFFVFQAKNKIFYKAKNPDNHYVFKAIKDEPYEEALKIVKANTIQSNKPKN